MNPGTSKKKAEVPRNTYCIVISSLFHNLKLALYHLYIEILQTLLGNFDTILLVNERKCAALISYRLNPIKYTVRIFITKC